MTSVTGLDYFASGLVKQGLDLTKNHWIETQTLGYYSRSMNDSFQIDFVLQVGLQSVRGSNSPIDVKLARYFASVRHEERSFDPEDLNPALSMPREDPIKHSLRVLADVIKDINKETRDPQTLEKSWASAASFFLSIGKELRTIICGKRKTPTKLGDQSRAIVTGVAVFLAHKLGISEATSTALAALILLTLIQATKNAFCKMDDIQVYKAIKKAEE